MKITPTLEECKIIAAEGSYGVIPISTEMYADMTTPIEVLRILKNAAETIPGEIIQEFIAEDSRAGKDADILRRKVQVLHKGGDVLQTGKDSPAPVLRSTAPDKLAADLPLLSFGKKQTVGCGEIAHAHGKAVIRGMFPHEQRLFGRPVRRHKIRTKHKDYPRGTSENLSWQGTCPAPVKTGREERPFQPGRKPFR